MGFLRPILIQIFGHLKIRYSHILADIYILEKKFQTSITTQTDFPNISYMELFMSPG